MDIDIYVEGKIHTNCYACDSEIVIDFSDFHRQYGEPEDWKGQVIKCPKCEYENEISDWDYFSE